MFEYLNMLDNVTMSHGIVFFHKNVSIHYKLLDATYYIPTTVRTCNQTNIYMYTIYFPRNLSNCSVYGVSVCAIFRNHKGAWIPFT